VIINTTAARDQRTALKVLHKKKKYYRSHFLIVYAVSEGNYGLMAAYY
jgi:hypothetical protein